MRGAGFLAAVAFPAFVCGCSATTAPADGSPSVSVYQAPWPPDGVVGMPAGCRMVAESPPQSWSETDLVSPDTFRAARARAAGLGANTLLLVEKLVLPRRDFDCAAAQPIGDCPRPRGAWYEVAVRAYACDESARQSLVVSAGIPTGPAEPR